MKSNLGSPDRILRIIAGVVIGILLATGTVAISSTLGIVLAIAGGIFLFTGLVNWCALYALLGISTKKANA